MKALQQISSTGSRCDVNIEGLRTTAPYGVLLFNGVSRRNPTNAPAYTNNKIKLIRGQKVTETSSLGQ